MGTNINKKKYVIITAGGCGTRMNSNIAKQFLELDGNPILLHTIKLFLALPFKVEILLVLPKEYKDYWKDYCFRNNINIKYQIVDGGITRYHSVKNALERIDDEDGVVAVHDGVRPFADINMIIKMFNYNFLDNNNCAGVVPVMPVTESMRCNIKDSKGNNIGTKTVDRSDYTFVQTPQVFDLAVLKKAYKKPYHPHYTDDASVVEDDMYVVDTIPGTRFNIKITVPEDLKLAKLIYPVLRSYNP